MNYKDLLRVIDSQETASIKEARKLLVEKLDVPDELADKWVRNDLRATFPILRDKKAAKFILGTTRLFVDHELNDDDSQNKLTRVLKEINESHYDEFDRNLNGLSLEKLYSPFEQKFNEDDEASRSASKSKTFGKSQYQITGPFPTFESARKAWGNKSQDWCVFHREDMFDSYTSAGQLFYVAARNGWQSTPKKVGTNTPKDEYGNSLIAISVDLNGNLATSTSRWNHENGGGDHTYTVDELEDILQVSFYDTFKPRKTELVAEWGEGGIINVRKVDGELKYSIDKNTFDKNFTLKGNQIIPKFKKIAPIFSDDKDRNDHKGYNFIDISGKLLSPDLWFSSAEPFKEGFAVVQVDDEDYNFIDTSGKLLSNQWFAYADSFRGGFACVRNLHNTWNFIDKSGKFLFNQWFDDIGDFSEGYATVKLVGKGWNFIDKSGKYLSNQWFDDTKPFHYGFAPVSDDYEGWNFIDKSGKLLSKRWFNYVGDFKEGFIRVKDDYEGWNFIDKSCKFLSNQWFSYAEDFSGGIANVYLENKGWNLIDTSGKVLSDVCFSSIYKFYEGCAMVSNASGYYNFIDKSGKLLSPNRWFVDAYNFKEGFARVVIYDEGWNFIDKSGKLLFNRGFDNATDFAKGFAVVKVDGDVHRINTEGKIVDSWNRAMNLLKR